MKSSSKCFRPMMLLGGLYLICFGTRLEIAVAAAAFGDPVTWAYHIALGLFAAAVAWSGTRFIRRNNVALGVVLMCVLFLLVAVTLYYLPWFLPNFDSEARFGWDPSFSRLVNSIFKLSTLIVGSLLVSRSIYFMSSSGTSDQALPNKMPVIVE